LVVPSVVARKIAVGNCEKMKQSAVVGIDDSWNHRRNGSVRMIKVIGVERRTVVGFERVRMENASDRGNYQKGGNGMEVETMRWIVKRWEDDQKFPLSPRSKR
jgi:hypothetical protein